MFAYFTFKSVSSSFPTKKTESSDKMKPNITLTLAQGANVSYCRPFSLQKQLLRCFEQIRSAGKDLLWQMDLFSQINLPKSKILQNSANTSSSSSSSSSWCIIGKTPPACKPTRSGPHLQVALPEKDPRCSQCLWPFFLNPCNWYKKNGEKTATTPENVSNFILMLLLRSHHQHVLATSTSWQSEGFAHLSEEQQIQQGGIAWTIEPISQHSHRWWFGSWSFQI